MLFSRAGSRHDAPRSIPSPRPGAKPKIQWADAVVLYRGSRQLKLEQRKGGFLEWMVIGWRGSGFMVYSHFGGVL